MKTQYTIIRLTLLMGCLMLASLGMAQTQTVIPAEPPTTADLVLTSAPPTTQGKQSIAFSLKSLPPRAVVKACTLRLTVKTMPTVKKELDVRLGASSIFPASVKNEDDLRRMARMTVDQRNKAETQVDLVFKQTLGVVGANSNGTLALDLLFDASTAASCTFYNTNDIPGYRPRLIIAYDSASTKPILWAQAHASAQRDRQCTAEFVGGAPTNYAPRLLSTCDAIREDMLIDGERIYLVNQAPNTVVSLLAIDASSGSQAILASAVPVPTVTPTMDPWRRLYICDANFATTIDLATNAKTDQVIAFGGTTPTSAPAIGPDGSLYFSFADKITAYAPFPNNRLSWLFSIPGTNGPVALNDAGTMAYFVSYRDRANQYDDTLFAINTISGRPVAKASVAMVVYDPATTGPCMPLVTEKGNIYLTNHLVNGTKLYAYDAQLRALQTVTASQNSILSLPVAGHGPAGDDDIVYFLNGGSLQQASGRTVESCSVTGATLAGNVGMRSVVADRSNNVYCIGVGNNPKFYAFVTTGNGKYTYIEKDAQLGAQVAFQGALIEGADGALYSRTSSLVYTFRPDMGADYTYTSKNVLENRRAFRAKTLLITGKATDPVVGDQVWLGKTAVKVESGLVIGSSANVVIKSSGTISFGPNFKVEKGATLRCKSGY